MAMKRLVVAALAATFVAGGAVVAPAAAPAVREAARIRTTLEPAIRHLDADIAARRLFEIGQPASAPGMRVVIRDLDRLTTVREVDLPDAISGRGGFLSAVDDLRHRLYVVYPVTGADDAAARNVLGSAYNGVRSNVRTVFGLAMIDTLRGEIAARASLALVGASPVDLRQSNSIGIKGLTLYRDGARDLLYMLTEVPAGLGILEVATHAVVLHELDAGRVFDTAAPPALNWSLPLAQCPLGMAREIPTAIFRSPTTPAIYVPCKQGGGQGLASQPDTPGIVRVRLGDGVAAADPRRFTTEYFPISGNLLGGVVAVDPVAERLFVKIDGRARDAAVWVFDTRAASWVGLVVLPPEFAGDGQAALGVDLGRGRLQAVSGPTEDGGLLVVSASSRTTSSDQGVVHRVPTKATALKMRPVVDPVTHRIFVRDTEGYLVISDGVPGGPQPGAPDPDANTAGVAEGDQTAVNFVGGGQAYGVRLRWVGGTEGVTRNANAQFENPPPEFPPNHGGLLPASPSPGTRDLHLARVLHATLSGGEASARATGAERDIDNTDADARAFAAYVRSWGGPDLASQRWPYPFVECTDFEGRAAERSDAGALVKCERAQSVSALAVDETFAIGSRIRIAQSRARSYAVRDAHRGVVTVTEAEVFGLDVAGRAGIGRVAARAETWATGRSRAANGVGAGSSYARTFEDVWFTGADGSRQVLCAAGCDAADVRAAFNRALGLRARIDLPVPDPQRAAGSPGGYEALVVRNPFERASDAVLNDEPDARRLEVPALVLTLFADGRVQSRVVVSLAAVAAESHYGIFLLSPGTGESPPSGGILPPPPRVPLPPSFTDEGPRPLPGPVTGSLPKRIIDGLRLTFASPARAARALGVWLLLAAPLILLIRRRAFPGRSP
jgi:hypothetical protein